MDKLVLMSSAQGERGWAAAAPEGLSSGVLYLTGHPGQGVYTRWCI